MEVFVVDIGNVRVMELIKQRNELLAEQPDLESLQEYWDTSMKKAGNQNNRLVVANRILMDQFRLLKLNIDSLANSLTELNSYKTVDIDSELE